MKFENVEILRLGVKDNKDRILSNPVFKESVPVLENSNPVHVHDFGSASNFKIVKGKTKEDFDSVICDVLVFDKFTDKLKIFLEQGYSLHPFIVGEQVKTKEGFKTFEKFGVSGLFFDKLKLYADSKGLKDFEVKK